MWTIEFNTLLNSVIVLMIGWVGKQGLTRLNAIRDHLAQLNGRLSKAETWELAHDKQDDERFRLTNERLAMVIDKLELHHLTEGMDHG